MQSITSIILIVFRFQEAVTKQVNKHNMGYGLNFAVVSTINYYPQRLGLADELLGAENPFLGFILKS